MVLMRRKREEEESRIRDEIELKLGKLTTYLNELKKRLQELERKEEVASVTEIKSPLKRAKTKLLPSARRTMETNKSKKIKI